MNPPGGVYDRSAGTYVDGTGQKLYHVHGLTNCRTKYCVIHNPSDHHMRGWPTHFRFDRGIMERICPHGIGHPDPDALTDDGIHGCDGCCATPAVELHFDDLPKLA